MILPSSVLKLTERLVPSSPSLVYHHTYPEKLFVNGTGNLLLNSIPDQNVKDTVVFLTRKYLFLWVSLINSFKQEMRKSLSQRKKNEKNIRYLIHSLWDRVFKGTVVNETVSYLYGGSVEITLTVPSSFTHLWQLVCLSKSVGELNISTFWIHFQNYTFNLYLQ